MLDLWICKQGCRDGVCVGERGEDQCYPVNKNIGSILGRGVIQELNSHCSSLTEPGSGRGLRSATVGLVRSEDGDLR